MWIAQIRYAKRGIRSFMREEYTDERLAMLLAHARDGKLAHCTCSCFAGFPSMQHPALEYRQFCGGEHAIDVVASLLFNLLGQPEISDTTADQLRRRRLIPMIRSEMKRREKLRAAPLQAVAESAASTEVVAK